MSDIRYRTPVLKMSLVHVLLFKVLNYLSSLGIVSGKVEFNACQVSLLWHNSL